LLLLYRYHSWKKQKCIRESAAGFLRQRLLLHIFYLKNEYGVAISVLDEQIFPTQYGSFGLVKANALLQKLIVCLIMVVAIKNKAYGALV
jgi:hypothetical protein